MQQPHEAPPRGDDAKRVLRPATVLVGLAALLYLYLQVAYRAPWPVEGSIGFVWGAGLVAVAIGYVLRYRDELSPAEIMWGIVFALISFALPICLNQLVDSSFLHTFHKLLAFIAAFYVFVAWITALRYRARGRSPSI